MADIAPITINANHPSDAFLAKIYAFALVGITTLFSTAQQARLLVRSGAARIPSEQVMSNE
jgi:hypothetical protein